MKFDCTRIETNRTNRARNLIPTTKKNNEKLMKIETEVQ